MRIYPKRVFCKIDAEFANITEKSVLGFCGLRNQYSMGYDFHITIHFTIFCFSRRRILVYTYTFFLSFGLPPCFFVVTGGTWFLFHICLWFSIKIHFIMDMNILFKKYFRLKILMLTICQIFIYSNIFFIYSHKFLCIILTCFKHF